MSARDDAASARVSPAPITRQGTRPRPERVLVIGSDKPDSVADSYRATLAPHYAVELVNPDRLLPMTIGRLAGSASRYLESGVQLLSNGLWREPLAFAQGGIIRAARAFAPDVILISHIQSLPPTTIEALRRDTPGARIIGVFSDHIANFERGYFFGAPYDALFFKDHFIVERFRQKLSWSHVWYLPQACDPRLHRIVPLSANDRLTYGCDLTIAGNMHYFRAVELEPLLGRDLKIWGAPVPSWLKHPICRHHQGRAVVGDDKCRAMAAARIVLNVNHYAEISGTNKRTFEVAAIGAFQLTDTPALGEVFDPDTEVATFDTQTDLLEKIDYFLARPDERAKMALRAHIRAHREHTYAHRWVAHLDTIGLDVPPSFPVQMTDVRVVAS